MSWDRTDKFLYQISKFRQNTSVTVGKAERLFRLMALTTSVVPHAHLKMHSSQTYYLASFTILMESKKKTLTVTKEIA